MIEAPGIRYIFKFIPGKEAFCYITAFLTYNFNINTNRMIIQSTYCVITGM